MQSKPLDHHDANLILACLNLTKILWDNSTNRNLYNSFEHLISFLSLAEIHIVYQVLKFLLKPAQRISSQRALKAIFVTAQSKLQILADRWNDTDLNSIFSNTQLPQDATTIKYHFYRTKTELDKLSSLSGIFQHPSYADNPTLTSDENSKSPSKLSKNQQSDNKEFFSKQPKKDSLDQVSILLSKSLFDHSPNSIDSPLEIAKQLQIQHNISQDRFFELFHRVRICFALQSLELRQSLMSISLAHYRGRLTEVLSSLNVSANHGYLMTLLRKVLSNTDGIILKLFMIDTTYGQDFNDTLFAFLTFVLSTQSGGNMIISAGIIPLLISGLENKNELQLKVNHKNIINLKNVTKCANMLDNILFGFPTSLNIFTGANGLDILVSRIKIEVDKVMEMKPLFTEEDISPSSILDPGANQKNKGLLFLFLKKKLDLLYRMPVLRSILKLILHMLQNSGSADGMRNLIDSSLPSTILIIFENSKLFSHIGSFGLAVNIMSTFIHNEPTSLTILQEANLPTAFLKAANQDLPVSAEVISALPNAFGALCLNATGLAAFQAASPIDTFLSVFTKQDHLRSLLDNDVPHLVGNSIDEFMRHHPTSKESVMMSIVNMLRKVVEIGEQMLPDEHEACVLIVEGVDVNMEKSDNPYLKFPDNKMESRMAQFIDVCSRFMEGLFQNAQHCKEFVKCNGVPLLLRFYSLASIPHDFATSPSSASLSYLFRVVIESNPTEAVNLMVKEIQLALDKIKPFLEDSTESKVLKYIYVNDKDLTFAAEAANVFRALVTLKCFIRLFTDLYCSHSLSHGKSVNAIVATFTNPDGIHLIEQFAEIARVCAFEKIHLIDNVPKEWYQKELGKKLDAVATTVTVPSTDEAVPILNEPSSSITPSGSGALKFDLEHPVTIETGDTPAAKNTQYLFHLVDEIPSDLIGVYRGMLKLICGRRVSDGPHRKNVQLIVDQFSSVMCNVLNWKCPGDDKFVIEYFSSSLPYLKVLLIEDKSVQTLQTIQVLSFYNVNGIDLLFKVLNMHLTMLRTIDKTAKSILDTDKLLVDRINLTIQTILEIFSGIVNHKLLNDSPYTTTLINRQKDKKLPDYFDSTLFLLQLRSAIFKPILSIWNHEDILLLSTSTTKLVTSILVCILNGEGETVSETGNIFTFTNLENIAGTVFSRAMNMAMNQQTTAAPPRVVVDPAKVQQLVEMGFPQGAAEIALTRCGNNVARAADYLLNHPGIVATAASAPPPAPAVQPVVEPIVAPVVGDNLGASNLETVAVPNVAPVENTEDASMVSAGESVDMLNSVSMAEASSSVMDTSVQESSSKPEEPKKEAEVENKEYLELSRSLGDIRETNKPFIMERALFLLDKLDAELIFSLKEILCLISKADISKVINAIIPIVNEFKEKLVTKDDKVCLETKTKLTIHLRLYAMIVSDVQFQSSALTLSTTFGSLLIELLSIAETVETWLTPLLLIVEAYVSLLDEPVEEKLEFPAEGTTPKEPTIVNKPPELTIHDREKIILQLIRLLKLDIIDNDVIHAVLRMIVRLTRNWNLACMFFQAGGITSLYKYENIAKFSAQHPLLMMILRHCIESPKELRKTMEEELTQLLTVPRSRSIDAGNFVKTANHIICRDPETFIKASSVVCKLAKYDPKQKQFLITHSTPLTTEKDSVVTSENDQAETTPISTPVKFQVPSDVFSEDKLSPVGGKLVHFLVTELMTLKHEVFVDDEAVKKGHIRRCFLLQSLSELIISYPSCRIDLINASLKRNPKHTPRSFGKNPFLCYLLSDILPRDAKFSNEISPADTPASLNKIAESAWASCLVTSLCYAKKSGNKDEYALELKQVRTVVLESIYKCLKDAIALQDVAVEVRYGKLISLSELCYKILSSKSIINLPAAKPNAPVDDHTFQIAQTMIEKGFVGVFTTVLAELDIHHPASQQVVAMVLKPLETLSRCAIRMGKTEIAVGAHKAKKLVTPGPGPSSFDNAFREIDHESVQDESELNDLYRNSALGMFEPTAETEDDDSMDSDDEVVYEEYADDAIEEGGEDSGDDESSTEDEMELVIPQPYHGAQDADDMMTSEDDDLNPELDVDIIDDDNAMSWDDEEDDDDDDEDDDDEEVEDEDDIFGGDEEAIDEEDNPFLPNPPDMSRVDEEMMEYDTESDDDDDEIDLEAFAPDGDVVLADHIAGIVPRMRQMLDVGLGPNGIEFHWAEGVGRLAGNSETDFQVFSRPPNTIRTANGLEDMSHPLLVSQTDNAQARNRSTMEISDLVDEYAGNFTHELYEQMFSRGRAAPGNAGFTAPGAASAHRGTAATNSRNNISATNAVTQPDERNETDKRLAVVHGYTLSFTEDRWKQEVRLMYGTAVNAKASRLINSMLNKLIPPAMKKAEEEKQKRLEAEKESARLQAELKAALEEKKKAEEAKAEEAKLQESEDGGKDMVVDEPAEGQSTAAPADNVAPSTNNPAPTTDGVPQESTEPAVVEEERVVVIVDGQPVDITGSGIDVTFLEALPDELRQEVINQYLTEQRAAQTLEPSLASSEINAEFLNALPIHIREEVLQQERLEAEQRQAAAAQSAPTPARTNTAAVPDITDILPNTTTATAKGKHNQHKESIQLLDQSGLASLLRLIFIPEPTGKASLDLLLTNLCENSKTRTELLGLLLSVLANGSHDLASVDRAFSQLTLKTRAKGLGVIEPLAFTPTNISNSEPVPNLVAQRCLESLTHLVSSSILVGKYFLTESESQITGKTPKSAKKGKGKEKPAVLSCPVVMLLNLLEKSTFLQNSIVLEQLMHLLSNVLRPLAHIAAKKYNQKGKKPIVDLSSASEPASTTTTSKTKAILETPSKEKDDGKDKEKGEIKLPNLPESSVCAVVNVLKDSVCSSKTFQYTLLVIQHLSSYPENLAIITRELISSAQLLGDSMIGDVQTLIDTLKTQNSKQYIEPTVLEPFTSTSSVQAKLLRILKSVDFMFLKYQGIEVKLTVSLDTYLAKFQPNNDENIKLTENELLKKIYEDLKLGKLWHKLGECMAVIDENEELIHIATVLLPFIESFMVVSKPSVSISKGQHSTQSNNNQSILIKQQSDIADVDQDTFFRFAEANKKVLNAMVRNNPTLMNGSFSLLVQNPKVLQFDNKRTYFNQQLHKPNERLNHGSIQLSVRRQYVFEDSYQQLQGRSGNTIKYGKLNVRFRDEEGVDAGGVTREWYSALAMQMFNPDYALFRPTAADKVTYQPNRSSGINPDHIFYFKFVGRIIGKAIYDGRLLDAYFTRSFYKCMINAPVDHKDLEAVEPEFYKSMDWMLNNDITDVLDLTFSMEVDDFGRQKIIDLKQNGRNIPVTEENKVEYVKLVTEQRLVVAIKDQIQGFLSGFHEIIPKDLIKIFNEQELELLISGLPDIDIDDWKNNTDYQNYTSSSPQIQWFWRAVRSFSQEERAKLIQFATGTSKVPLGGFAQLQGSSGIQKFQIHKEFSSALRLPSAHTCFNQIDLPQYESYEQLRNALLTAISECGTGFGFA
ncbi:hypothetical protein HDV02_000306 [Globomyces sp. JEL0801]|nr:hypothetical protein HDV02_000306 [Globomyces sp. JEL0801]